MNVNPLILSALASLTPIPIEPNRYKGTATTYIVFNYADERPVVSGSDEDFFDTTAVQVHYFTKTNPQANKKVIRRLLKAAGFTITNTQEFYETETEYNHVVVEVEIDGAIDD